eukprot:EG_transcript_63385
MDGSGRRAVGAHSKSCVVGRTSCCCGPHCPAVVAADGQHRRWGGLHWHHCVMITWKEQVLHRLSQAKKLPLSSQVRKTRGLIRNRWVTMKKCGKWCSAEA